MSDTTQNIPPGWYPDANAPGGQRWWDGAAWTEHTGQDPAQQYQPLEQPKAPEGTKTGTLWIWLLAVSPLLSLVSLFLVDWKQFVDASLGNPTNPYAQLGVYTSPGYIISSVLGWVFYGLIVVFAALDWRELRKRGVPKPFHWAFAFLGNIVYVIGRQIVVRRRAGGGLGPLWLSIVTTVIVTIAFVIFTVLLMNYMFASISQITSFS